MTELYRNEDDDFITSCYGSSAGNFSFHVWYKVNGGLTILCASGNDYLELQNRAEVAKSNFKRLGLIRCCECHKMFKYEKIKNNQHFAGIYCNKCWNEPRFVEERRKETYD